MSERTDQAKNEMCGENTVNVQIAVPDSVINLRIATPEDAEAILGIYAPYVRETAITFEYEVPAVEEFRQRIENTLRKYPYLVAESRGRICGYAYASSFHTKAAYDWAAEGTIYIRKDCIGKGIGRVLYEALEGILKKQHITNLNACIAVTETADEHLTNYSQSFHGYMGYQMVGTFHKCGYKFGKWYDMIWMEKMLGEHPNEPEKVVPWYEVRDEFGL